MKCNHKTIINQAVAIMLVLMATASMAIAGDSITGTIAEKGEYIVLHAADGSYILEGGEMNPEMIGKKVTVTGSVAVKENMRVINVTTVKEVNP